MKVFVVFIFGLFIEANCVPLERFIRALPPKYLAIDGHEDCTVSYKISSSSALCFPLSKPPSCSDASWQNLGNAYGVNNGISERINIGGIGGLPPAYLSVEGHEDCLGSYDAATARIKCLPKDKPTACSNVAWNELINVFEGEECPDDQCKSPKIKWKGCPRIGGLNCDACFSLEYDDVEGGSDTLCMKEGDFPCTFNGNLTKDGSYVTIQASDGKCRPFGSDPLDVDLSSKRCGGLWKVDDPSPSNGIAKRTDGAFARPEIIGGIGGTPPAYLSVEGHENCLGTYEDGPATLKCLPVDKPKACRNVAWNELINVWEGEECPEDFGIIDDAIARPEIIGGIGGTPPAYLSVEGHEDCLGSFEKGSASIKCLPSTKPRACKRDAWQTLVIVFEGDECPEEDKDECPAPKISWVECRRAGGKKCDACFAIVFDDAQGGSDTMCMKQGDFPCIFTGNLVNDGSYVAVTASNSKCEPFGSDPLEVSLSSERCGGSWKVDNPSASDGIARRPGCVFCNGAIDEVLEPEPVIFGGIGSTPPAYLSVEGHKDCLGTYEDGPATIKCLPVDKPSACKNVAWNELIKVWDGEECRPTIIGGIGGIPPAYLSIEGHKNCLGTYEDGPATIKCLPVDRPSACKSAAWTDLNLVWDGEQCRPRNIGGIGGSPPAYLSIIGHEKCLGTYDAAPARLKCLPQDKPSDCTNVAWNELVKVWEGQECPEEIIGGIGGTPPAYLSVEGHEDCLGSYDAGSATIKCLPSDKPSACKSDAWQTLVIVFEGDECPNEEEDQCKSPKIKWKGCPRIGGLDCDACFSIEFDDSEGGSDTLCMKEGDSPCIYTGNLMKDGSYAAITASDGKCRPFGSDPLEVSLASERCGGSWKVDDPSPSNGIAKRPGCVFCNGVTDEVLVGSRIIGSPAPEYLSIPGHKTCLGSFNASPSHSEKCLPKQRPPGCLPETWTQVKDAFDGSTCPDLSAVTQIEDHHLCLKPVVDSANQCITFTPDPGCPEDVHAQILNAVFEEPESRILFHQN